MQKISHSQSIELGLLFMGLSNIRALRLMLIYFHIPKKTTRFMFPSFCSALSDSLSWLLSSVHCWLCSFVFSLLSYACSLHLSKCLLCPLSHVHLLDLVKSSLAVGVSCKGKKGENLPLRPQTTAAGHKPDPEAQQQNYAPFI